MYIYTPLCRYWITLYRYVLVFIVPHEDIELEDNKQFISNRHSGSVVERPLCDREVAGSIPGRVIPKTLKMVLAALSLGAQH